ncbi:MAG: DUF1292 domain-containing protein [Tissierellia bacterium]|nr:DUF1292 domain-containing protein [Tissierellia bacterium]
MDKDMERNDAPHVHDENCDHDHHHGDYDDVETIVLTLNDDSELECVVLGIFEVDDVEYMALVTLDDEQVLLYRYLEDGEQDGDFTLENIDSDEEFDTASQVFFEIFGDEDEEIEVED